MIKNMSKRKISTECQYKSDCYRKNPLHFESFSHSHIEAIVSKGRKNGLFQIPRELNLVKDTVTTQCAIVEKILQTQTSTSLKKQAFDSEFIHKMYSTDTYGSSEKMRKIVETTANSADKLKYSLNNVDFVRPETSSNSASNSNNECQQPKKNEMPRNVNDYFSVIVEKGKIASKLKSAAPYNFFLTSITSSKETHEDSRSITFMELLDDSLGCLESSVHLNFIVDISWLLANYFFAEKDDKPMLVLYGEENEDLKRVSAKYPHIQTIKVDMQGKPFSIHHSKVSIFFYKDGSSRIVISSANLYADDWNNRVQGLWISPTLSALPDGADLSEGESSTLFKDDFLRYLAAYDVPRLQPYISRLRRTNFSSVNVVFVGSVPGGHRDVSGRGPPFGHPRVGYILSKHCAPVEEPSSIVAQSSSIGSLGNNLNAYIGNEWLHSFKKDSGPARMSRIPQFKLIYPSFSNVKNSLDALMGGGCLPYRRTIHEKQTWLKEHMCQWRATKQHRDRAMPHIKTYGRFTKKGLHWFILTSANCSKAAWGVYNKTTKLDSPLRINNYEAGVLFLPKFVHGQDVFSLESVETDDKNFPMPYDIPLTPYSPEDVPFVMDYLEQYLNAHQI